MDAALIVALKAFVDPSRLRILGQLAGGSMAVDELAATLGWTPRTLERHLAMLRAASLVSATAEPPIAYALRPERLHEIARALTLLEDEGEASVERTETGGSGVPPDEAKVLRDFFVGDRLTTIPAQEAKRRIVVRHLFERCFAEDRPYPEREVNARLSVHHEDTALLRRSMVEDGLLTRTNGVYRRAVEPPMARIPVPSSAPGD